MAERFALAFALLLWMPYKWSVLEANSLSDPAIITDPVLPEGYSGATYSLELRAAGGAGGYRWSGDDLPAGMALSSGGLLEGAPQNGGSFNVTVTDQAGRSSSQTLALLVRTHKIGPGARLPNARFQQAYSQALSVSGGTPPYSWTAAPEQLPLGLSLSGAGVVSGNPGGCGDFRFPVAVTDGAARTTTRQLALTVLGPGRPPLAIRTGEQLPEMPLRRFARTELLAAGGTPPYTWSAQSSLPAGLYLEDNAFLAGAGLEAGSSQFTLRVADSAGAEASRTFRLNISSITILNATLPDAQYGISYSQALAATGGEAPYSFTGDPPAGLVLSVGGTLSGTPRDTGDLSVNVQVTDAAGISANVPVSLRIASGAGGTLQLSVGPEAAVLGREYLLPISTGAAGDVTLTLAAGSSLPEGLMLLPGAVWGVPGESGIFEFEIQARDTQGNVGYRNVRLDIRAEPEAAPPAGSGDLEIATDPLLPSAASRQPYAAVLSASGGKPPYSWTATAITPGLVLSPDGVLTGVPECERCAWGLTAMVTDANYLSVSKRFTGYLREDLGIGSGPALPLSAAGSRMEIDLAAFGGTPPHTWSGTSLPPGLELTSEAGRTWLAGFPSAPGSYNFTLQLADAGGRTLSRTYALTVSPVHIAPRSPGASYPFSYSALGGIPPHSWTATALPAGMSLSAAGVLSGNPQETGEFRFDVQVSDASGHRMNRAGDRLLVPGLDVTPHGLPEARLGREYRAGIAFGGKGSYSWSLASGSSLPPGVSLYVPGVDGWDADLWGLPSAAGNYRFTLNVTDGEGSRGTRIYHLHVSPLASATDTAVTAILGVPFTEVLDASGGSGGYRWSVDAADLPPGLNLDSSGKLSGTPSASGVYELHATATDIQGNTGTFEFRIEVGLLSVTTPGLPNAKMGSAYSAQLEASGGTQPYSWSSWSGLPGLSLGSDGRITGTPQSAGTLRAQIDVTDAQGTLASKTFAIEVLPAGDTPPLVSGALGDVPLGPISAGSALDTSLTAAGRLSGGAPPYSWSLVAGSSLPPGMAITGERLSGWPAAGSYRFTLQAADSEIQSLRLAFTLEVSSIRILTPAVQAVLGRAVGASLFAIGGTAPYRWSAAAGDLPSGLALDSGGTITGTPAESGVFSFPVRVTDQNGKSATARVESFQVASGKARTIAISPGSASRALPRAQLSGSYSAVVWAWGGAPPYSWALANGSKLPAGLALSASADTSSAEVAGTASECGDFPLWLRVTDSAGNNGARLFTLAVDALADASPLLWAAAGEAYAANLAAAGGTPPYSWALSSGSTLPAGFTLSSAGLLSGASSALGSYDFKARVSDSASHSSEFAYRLHISGVRIASPELLPEAILNQAYSQPLQASGGTPPYSWLDPQPAGEVGCAPVPAGLKLSAAGTLSGTPGNPGTFRFCATATDSAGQAAARVFQLTVKPPEEIGFFRAGMWLLDASGNGQWDGPQTDRLYWIGQAADTPLAGDWNGDGRKEIGFFRNGMWLLDYNGNGQWDGPEIDRLYWIGQAGDTPLLGDWNGDGKDEIGIFRNGMWLLDYNGNGQWDGPAADRLYWIGQAGDTPLVGDWNGDGKLEIGFFRNGMWLLDYNGNGQWDGPAADRLYWIGQTGDTPLTGDWNGDGKLEIGFFRNGMWLLDYNGNGQWDGPAADRLYWIGQAGDTPLTGDWNADGKDEIGFFRAGMWLLDFSGNGCWDGPAVDGLYWLGQAGDAPLEGSW